MHPAAKQWDIDHGFVPAEWPHGGTKDRPVPENRPCYWCGCVVEKGYIHEECAKKEREVWFDIIY
jgi:hypothetical protein